MNVRTNMVWYLINLFSCPTVKFTQAMDPDIVRYPGDETTNQALYIKCVAKLEDGSILIGGM